VRVDAEAGTFETELDSYHADVGTVVPPQCAGAIATVAGVADRSGWCPISSATFESTLVPGIHVIGDAAITGALPKSAGAANAEAKICAAAVVALLHGEPDAVPALTGACYSLAAPDFGFSLAGSYRPDKEGFAEVETTASPLDAPASERSKAAHDGEIWFQTITNGIFN
jgi:NADPH-dependent 2,4-dienoyl-CoA reductase/sulfur reductase-like enzyme